MQLQKDCAPLSPQNSTSTSVAKKNNLASTHAQSVADLEVRHLDTPASSSVLPFSESFFVK